MNKTAKIILGIVIAIIVVGGAYFCVEYFFNTQEASNNTNINNTNGNMALVENNTVENNVIENDTAIENNVIENSVEENTVDNEENNTVETEEVQKKVSSNNDSEIESDSDEEKAISIVKKDWGSTDGVYFKVQAVDANGNYVISVNNEETTQVMEWYTVNPKTGEFSN